jgi:hypothetical protein
MNRSLFIGLAFFFPFPVFGTCKHEMIFHQNEQHCNEKKNAKAFAEADLHHQQIWS